MKTDNIELTKEIVELKYKTLMQRIERIFNLFKTLSVIIDCDSEIKSIKMILEQYKRMYNQLIKTGEYQKYEDIENTIIENLSKIEFKLDKKIHSTARDYKNVFEGIFGNIRESINYREFHNLYEEIEKIKWIKELAKQYIPFISENERNDINNKISKFKFELLIRRQVEQMVYENGGIENRLWMDYDDQEELEYFMNLLEQTIKNAGIQDDDVLQEYSIERIIRSNRLLNHLIFRVLEQDIEANPQKYISLLDAKIFNPHMCNIANDPYEEMIPYAKIEYKPVEARLSRLGDPYGDYYKRKRVNLSLLLALLKDVIGDENTTIMECNNIYKRFGFECKPIVFYEGQEIVRRIFNKVKDNLKPQEKNNNNNKGQSCKINFIGYDYNFYSKEEPFFTEAQIYHQFANALWFEDLHAIDHIITEEQPHLQLSGMKKLLDLRNSMIAEMTKVKDNEWVRLSLEQVAKLPILRPTEIPEIIVPKNKIPKPTRISNRYSPIILAEDYSLLWKEYEKDFRTIGIRVERIMTNNFPTFDVSINLDDISDLPIDFSKIDIITKDEIEEVSIIEGNER